MKSTAAGCWSRRGASSLSERATGTATRSSPPAAEIGRASCRERVEISVCAGSSRRRHTRSLCDWSSDVCSSDLIQIRSQPIEDGLMRGYQCDIGAGWWGKLYEEHGRGLLEPKGGEQFVRKGDWNRYEIIASSSRDRKSVV